MMEDEQISAHLSQEDIERLTEPYDYFGLATAAVAARVAAMAAS